jgi:dihydrofolate reductase
MRNVIMWNMVSLDGYFETPDHELDWFAFDDDLERYILDTQETAETLLFGRNTYQGMEAYWTSAEGTIADFMNDVEKIVFSRSLASVDWNNTTLVKGNVPEFIAELKRGPGENIFVFGSADFSSTLMQHGLIDEYRIGINPIVLGNGTPLFKDSPERLHLELLEARPFKSGLVILHYRPA